MNFHKLLPQDPPPTMATVESLLPTICNLLNYSDKNVLSDACWALSYITDGSNDRIEVRICFKSPRPPYRRSRDWRKKRQYSEIGEAK